MPKAMRYWPAPFVCYVLEGESYALLFGFCGYRGLCAFILCRIGLGRYGKKLLYRGR